MTCIGKIGPSSAESAMPTTTADSATTIACRPSPAAMEPVGTPIALYTAKSRSRSSAER